MIRTLPAPGTAGPFDWLVLLGVVAVIAVVVAALVIHDNRTEMGRKAPKRVEAETTAEHEDTHLPKAA